MVRITPKKCLKFICVLLVFHLIFKIMLRLANVHTNVNIKHVSFFLLINKFYSHMKWSIDVKKGIIDESDIKNYMYKNYTDENDDWELVDNNIYISRQLSFYFIEERIVSSIIISRFLLISNLFCLIQNDGNSFIIKSNLVSLETHQDVTFYKLQCLIPHFKTLKSTNLQVYFIYKHHIYINSIVLSMERTKRPIILKTKTKFNMNHFKNSTKSQIALCGPMLYLTSKGYKQLETWIKMNHKIGYKKIILYLISVEDFEKYKKLFNKYKDLVEIRYYRKIPNVFYLRLNQSNPYMDPENYVKALRKSISKNRYNFMYLEIELHWVHHRAIINGCFLSCLKDYERVTVIDTDELVIPISGSVSNLFFNKEKLSNLPSTVDNTFFESQLKKVKCEYDINKYINRLNFKNFSTNYVSNVSIWLPYSHFIDFQTVQSIFHYFKKYYLIFGSYKNPLNFTVFDAKGNFTFTVDSENDFDYLKSLITFFENVYSKYLIKLEDQYLNRIWSIRDPGSGKVYFNLLFSLINKICFILKSIHQNINLVTLYHHWVIKAPQIDLSFNDGSVFHFRDFVHRELAGKFWNIKNLKVNLDYLKCFLINNN
jgi:hypothetical protein